MPHPASMLAFYPPDDMKDMIKKSGCDTVHIYVDMKNAMTSTYIYEVKEEIVLNSKNMGGIDSTIFQSLLFYSAWWKRFCKGLGVKCEIFIQSDYGKSIYHNDINPKYKYRRYISDVDLTAEQRDVEEKFQEIRKKNSQLARNIIERLPGIHFIYLDFLESDFVPYYLITKKFPTPNVFHIITSNDKDMYQILPIKNVVQVYKLRQVKTILDNSNFMNHFCKLGKDSQAVQDKYSKKLQKFDNRWFSAYMSIMGDMGDDVPGIKGFGAKKCVDLFIYEKLTDLIGTSEELEDRVAAGGSFFKSDIDFNLDWGPWNKIFTIDNFEQIITDAFKQISYEQLVRWLFNMNITKKSKWIKSMDFALDKQTCSVLPVQSFTEGLSQIKDCYLTEKEVNFLYME